MNNRISDLVNKNYEMELRQKEERLRFLHAQLNPHFLYNTLTTIRCIAYDNRIISICSIVDSLSHILTYILRNEASKVALRDDLMFLQEYCNIMRYRKQCKFTLQISCEENLYNTLVPKLFLQPFVENSIIHAFKDNISSGEIKINCYIQNSKRIFVVEDNGIGMSDETIKGIFDEKNKNVGIKNMMNQIRLLYGEEATINIISKVHAGTKIIIELPISTEGEHTIS